MRPRRCTTPAAPNRSSLESTLSCSRYVAATFLRDASFLGRPLAKCFDESHESAHLVITHLPWSGLSRLLTAPFGRDCLDPDPIAVISLVALDEAERLDERAAVAVVPPMEQRIGERDGYLRLHPPALLLSRCRVVAEAGVIPPAPPVVIPVAECMVDVRVEELPRRGKPQHRLGADEHPGELHVVPIRHGVTGGAGNRRPVALTILAALGRIGREEILMADTEGLEKGSANVLGSRRVVELDQCLAPI